MICKQEGNMDWKRLRSAIATVLTIIMAALMPVSAFADVAKAELPGLREAFVTRSITDLTGQGVDISSGGNTSDDGSEAGNDNIPGEDEILDQDEILDEEELLEATARTSDRRTVGGVVIASDSSARAEYLIDGQEKDSISFFVKRDGTNEVIEPDLVVLSITQTAGLEAFGEIEVKVGVPGNPEDGLKDKIEIIPPDSTYLEPGKTLEFGIKFVVSDEMRAGEENIYNDGTKNFITISGRGAVKHVPVYYGIDGLYSAYSTEWCYMYDGAPFTDTESGIEYRLVGHIKLNDTKPEVFTIRHQFGVFGNMTGVDSEGNVVPLEITRAKLNPKGNFVFADGSTEMVLREEGGLISIPIILKENVFKKWKKDAAAKNDMKLSYMLLVDLVIEYNDGYLSGGQMSSLPLVYAVSYIPPTSEPETGGSSGSGGSGGGSGTTSTGTVQGGPAATPRMTYAASDDVGWVQKDGVWYYMDASNAPVKDWLLGPDGRWYFLGADGVMKTGWMQLGGTWYFLNADGAMANGWVQGADGKWYYLQMDGKMAVDMTTPDGYYVDQDGVWIA